MQIQILKIPTSFLGLKSLLSGLQIRTMHQYAIAQSIAQSFLVPMGH